MSMVNKIIVEDVRVFKGRQEFEIRPLTFVIGENSAGKTAFLGCIQTLLDWYKSGDLNFNASPYSMGSFDNIARGHKGQEKKFALGFEAEIRPGKHYSYRVTFKKEKKGAEPKAEQEWHKLGNKKKTHRLGPAKEEWHIPSRYWRSATTAGAGAAEDKFAQQSFPHPLPPHSLGPFRADPKRTYDPIKGTDSSQGDDIPMYLRDLHRGRKKQWGELRRQLIQFGKESGLFTDITVKAYGKSDSEPFQLHIKTPGSPKANLVDVGYGISQVLPILVHALSGSFLLMQQPEARLHPKGQATLSSLLATLAQPHKKMFVVETHSDYIVDRARIEVRKGTLAPEDLSILYLDGNKVHNLKVDGAGNLLNSPRGYRDFFLEETNRFLGLE